MKYISQSAIESATKYKILWGLFNKIKICLVSEASVFEITSNIFAID